MLRVELLNTSFAVVCMLAGWASAARAEEPVDLSGKWRGEWVSCQTGHCGRLSARFCTIDDTCYRVQFAGTFWVAVPFRFTVNLAAAPQADGTVVLTGSPRLPFFGTFQFAAVATERDFQATYSTARDNGRFTLHR
jgi:hypothetical protein